MPLCEKYAMNLKQIDELEINVGMKFQGKAQG